MRTLKRRSFAEPQQRNMCEHTKTMGVQKGANLYANLLYRINIVLLQLI